MKQATNTTELDIETLGYYVHRALFSMIKRLHKELKAQNLNFTHSDYTILRALDQKNGLTQTEISKIIGKEKSGVSRSINSLERQGYIFRTPANGCTNEVFISEKGKEVIPVLNDIAHRVTDRAFTGFGPKKRREMMTGLSSIYRNSI